MSNIEESHENHKAGQLLDAFADIYEEVWQRRLFKEAQAFSLTAGPADRDGQSIKVRIYLNDCFGIPEEEAQQAQLKDLLMETIESPPTDCDKDYAGR